MRRPLGLGYSASVDGTFSWMTIVAPDVGDGRRSTITVTTTKELLVAGRRLRPSSSRQSSLTVVERAITIGCLPLRHKPLTVEVDCDA